jgi:Phosphatidylserine/phosphatidylglycerophosphate/cardiolipin synthases and related enzymes
MLLGQVGIAAMFMVASLCCKPCIASEQAAQLPVSVSEAQHEEAFFSPPQNDLRQKLINLINSEQRSLKIAIYHITDQSIIWAILRAVKRDCDVYIVVDRDHFARLTEDLKRKLDGIIPANLHIVQSVLPDIRFMHHKFVLFEKNECAQSLLWIGSYNFTRYPGSEIGHDSAVLLDDQSIITAFRNEFARLIGQEPVAQPDGQEGVLLGQPTVIKEAFFSPGGGSEQALLDLIQGEQDSIKIAIDEFTNFKIVRALASLARSLTGTAELIIFKLSHEQMGPAAMLGYNSIEDLQRAGIMVYEYTPQDKELMHHKFAIFKNNVATIRGKQASGRQLVWTGSYNFTTAAESNNCESSVLLDTPSIVQKFVDQFEMLKEKHSKEVRLKKRMIFVVDSELQESQAVQPLKRKRL